MMKTFRGFGRSLMRVLWFIAARGSEPSTYATLTAVLAAAHFSVDPGAIKTLTTLGIVVCGALGVLLREAGRANPFQVAADVVDELKEGLSVNASPDDPDSVTRRQALKVTTGGTAALLLLSLARCGSSGTITLPAAVVTAVGTFATVAQTLSTLFTSAFLSTLGVSGSSAQEIATDVSEAASAASQFSVDVQNNTAPAGSDVQTAVNLVEDAIGIALPLVPAAAPELTVLASIVALVPTITSAFGVTAAPLHALPANVPAIDPATALQNLQNWLATHPAA